MGNCLKPERHWADDEPWDSEEEFAKARRSRGKMTKSQETEPSEAPSTRIKITITKKELRSLATQDLSIMEPERSWADDEDWNSDEHFESMNFVGDEKATRRTTIKMSKKQWEELLHQIGQQRFSINEMLLASCDNNARTTTKACGNNRSSRVCGRPWRPRLESISEMGIEEL
ncbi:uncharacterized protein A4U43_C06F1800 [Asparagus officinalis]|uniref:Uncharacterized protein n=1 Tax=Asparagus officinalis TaxID=4686 RepID=A0A5P1EIS8_ASPOF|nr:uncharacterized protein A4U43_C06F1800 [Asparagus officinalis]